jgi:L-malate glycosyltransferase
MLLAGANAIHTHRWAHGLVTAGVDVVCVSLHPFAPGTWDRRMARIMLTGPTPWGYFTQGARVRQLFAEHRCDLLNAHYASGYGMLAMRSRVHPCLLSVWGSDVYDFPGTSRWHRALIQRTLMAADQVASTSHVMARQVQSVLGDRWASLRVPLAITPFGVDTMQFVPRQNSDRLETGRPVVVGTVKTLEPKYGIDTLLRAFARLRAPPSGVLPVLRIAGSGREQARLQTLADALKLGDRVTWLGAIAHAEVPATLQDLDIFVAASRLDSESFGVAVIEASACEKPVVVTRVGGLPEVVVGIEDDPSAASVSNAPTGLIVPRDDVAALTSALQRLVDDPALRLRLGQAGRRHVQARYEWRDNVAHMINVYKALLLASDAPTRRGDSS